MMTISHFYEEVLGANLANARWSWGAVDPVANRVYLRVWQDEIDKGPDGERVLVLRKAPKAELRAPGSSGYPERQRHLDAIRKGAEGYGVVCVARFTPDNERKIATFDTETLLVLGDIVNVRGGEYALISSRIPVAELERQKTGHGTLLADLKATLRRSKIKSTSKEALVAARIGQGIFRTLVLGQWDGRCAVTGSNTLDAVRASHIKPWRQSSDAQRLDPMNGLPLVATLDALFDAGLVSFDDAGKMLISTRLGKQERSVLGLGNGRLRKTPPSAMRQFLAEHRKAVYQG